VAEPAPRRLVIGVGALDAGDDAAGRIVAQRLQGARRDFDVAETRGLATDLVSLFEDREDVVIVDACRSGAKAGTLHRIDLGRGEALPAFSAVSCHDMGVGEAIRLAEVLGVLPPRCQVWAIEGADFALGKPLSAAVAHAVDGCIRELLEL
jgi:hydrogenase maturation protease